jgi:pilus assembly protein CpaB
MRARPLIAVVLGLGMASGSVFYANQYVAERPGQAVAHVPQMEVTRVVVARADVAFGESIGWNHLREQDWPTNSVPKDSFYGIQDVLGEGREARVALRPIAAGEPILASKVSGFGERASLSSVVSAGSRAFAIKVDAATGVSGFVMPGDRVDVLMTRAAEGRDDMVSDVILRDIVVRAVDQISDEDRSKPQVARTVTVEVTPEGAQKLALAQQVGRLTLALRNARAAPDTAGVRTVRVHDLLPEPPVSPLRTVKVRRAGELSHEQVRPGELSHEQARQ